MAPATAKAIVIESAGKAEIEEVPVPKLRDDYILVRTTAVALNPTDAKHIDGHSGKGTEGTRSGCDYAGIVEAVGSKVTKDFKKGDRVCGFVHGSNGVQKEDGGFGEYIVAKGDLQIKNPVSDIEGATLGVGVSTCGQGLYQALKLPLPTEPTKAPFPVLIYGGSTATGMLGVQYAKLSGCTVITTASPRNFDYLKSLGADACFDYNSPTCSADIRAYTQNKLRYAWDCIATADATKLCAQALSDDELGGTYGSLLPVPADLVSSANPKAKAIPSTLAYTCFGEFFDKFDAKIDAKPEDLEFGKMFWELSRQLLADGKLKAARTVVNKGGKGLEGVFVGLDDLRHGRVSGVKLVYTLE